MKRSSSRDRYQPSISVVEEKSEAKSEDFVEKKLESQLGDEAINLSSAAEKLQDCSNYSVESVDKENLKDISTEGSRCNTLWVLVSLSVSC